MPRYVVRYWVNHRAAQVPFTAKDATAARLAYVDTVARLQRLSRQCSGFRLETERGRVLAGTAAHERTWTKDQRQRELEW